MNPSTLTVRQSILISSGFGIFLLCGMLVAGWTGFASSQSALRYEHEVSAKAQLAILDARFHVVQIQQFLTDVSATSDRDGFQNADKQLKMARVQLDALARLQSDLQVQTAAIAAQLERYHKAGVHMAEAYIARGQVAGNELMKAPDGFDAMAEMLTASLEKLEEQVRGRAGEAAAGTERDIDRASLSLLVMGILAIVLAAISGWLLHRRLLRLLGDEPAVAVRVAERIAQGDLSAAAGNVAAGSLLDSLDLTRRKLAQSVGTINSAGEMLTHGVTDIGAMSARMKAVLQEHAGTTATLAATFEEIAQSVHGVNANAQEANGISVRLSASANDSKQRIREAIAGIKGVADDARCATGAVGELNAHADAIRSIVGTIKEIADQTNLLALNAAIEAARAGEQGRGFAVVADEVRKLAERTSASTQEVATMVERIEAGTHTAIRAMDLVAKAAGDSATKADVAECSILEIVDGITHASASVGDISLAIQEQAAAVEQAAQSLNEMSTATDENYQSALELSAIAGRIDTAERDLAREVAHFRI